MPLMFRIKELEDRLNTFGDVAPGLFSKGGAPFVSDMSSHAGRIDGKGVRCGMLQEEVEELKAVKTKLEAPFLRCKELRRRLDDRAA